MEVQVSHRIYNGIFNHTSLCEFYQGRLLLHLTILFEEKPKTNQPSDNLRYYRQRKNMTTRQLAEYIDVVPATVLMYENGKHPIPHDIALRLAEALEIDVSLLFDDFSRFLATPYTEALKGVRTALGLSYCHIFIKGCSGEDYTGFFQTVGYIERDSPTVCDSEQHCICTEIPSGNCIWEDKSRCGGILRESSERKGVEILEAECCLDHIHMLVAIPPHLSVAQYMG